MADRDGPRLCDWPLLDKTGLIAPKASSRPPNAGKRPHCNGERPSKVVHQTLYSRHLTLAILSTVQVNLIIFTITCINCDEGILDSALARAVLLPFAGLNAA